MNRLFFLPDLDGGGAQRTLVNLINGFAATGARATLAVVRADGPARDWIDGHVDLVDLAVGRTRRAVLPLRRLLRERRPDIVLSTMIDANIVAAAARLGLSRPPRLILRETNSHRARGDLGPARRRLVRWAYRRADAVVALSEGVGAELIADYGLDPARVTTIHNPVDTAAFESAAARAREGAPPWGDWAGSAPVLVGAGRLTRQKGFDILIDAFARSTVPEARLVLIGDGAERDNLAAQARRAGLGDRLLMPGFVADPASWFAHASLFVLSSRWEGFGHVLVEAMASGAPVLATDCPHGPRDIITDGVDGRLAVAGDPGALAAAIDALLSDGPLRAKLAEAGRLRARRFDRARIVGEYDALMMRLCAGRPMPGTT